ncbi:aldo-keto reductase [Reticulomyxa filosa]|uniref:Aldo-keto reductase n=1 Tax=Reticulomyxa filosa TaxID=46433 RepID=X6NHE8_RETFI|nr:aldo-keto reductase [Reticulomyxa filosa]|eukprot:ETO25323.1 aldo-keto reductase [Reticulomyxa filosa]
MYIICVYVCMDMGLKEMSYPMVSLGTGGLNGMNENYQVIKDAVTKYGYAAIDSASTYESESTIGTLLTENKALRSQLTLDAMKINYVDLYMIHWPVCYDDLPFVDCSQSKDGKWQQSYDALTKLYAEGVVLNLGGPYVYAMLVFNWDEQLLNDLLQEFPIIPQVMQNHVDLTRLDWDFFDVLHEYRILLQAYSPLRGLAQAKEPEQIAWKESLDQLAQEIEEDQGIKISISQLVLRFFLENDIAVIPMSTKSLHLQENNNFLHFELTSDHNVRMGGREPEKQEL